MSLPSYERSCSTVPASLRRQKNLKRLLILRHGEAVHNPRAEKARKDGCTYEHFLHLIMQDDAFDASLTDLGEDQAKNCGRYHGGTLSSVELVVSSPLSRALRTADLALPPTGNQSPRSDCAGEEKSALKVVPGSSLVHPRRVCLEEFREINGRFLNSKRKLRSDLEKIFGKGGWDFSQLTEQDETWTERYEPQSSCGERGYQGLLWLMQQREEQILLVSHGGLLRLLMEDHPNLCLVDERPAGEKRFENCELREFVMTWHYEDAEKDGIKPHFSAVSLVERRLIVTLTEVEGRRFSNAFKSVDCDT